MYIKWSLFIGEWVTAEQAELAHNLLHSGGKIFTI